MSPAGQHQKTVEIFWRIERAGERTGLFAGGVVIAVTHDDGLGLATSMSHIPLRSSPPLGRASYLPGRVGKRVISGNLQKKKGEGRERGILEHL